MSHLTFFQDNVFFLRIFFYFALFALKCRMGSGGGGGDDTGGCSGGGVEGICELVNDFEDFLQGINGNVSEDSIWWWYW